jgi:hypothetical protein
MVTRKPDLRQAPEFYILCDLPRVQVAVVIDNGHFTGIIMVQPDGCFALQQEILIEEFFHGFKY